MYGSRFADMWTANNIDEVKKCWSDELRIFSVEQVGIAVGHLKNKNFPPTLPEFLQLCESARAQAPRVTHAPALPAPVKGDNYQRELAEAKARCMATVKRLGGTFGEPSTKWLDRLFERQEAGEILQMSQIEMMKRAVAMGYQRA